MQWRLPLAGWVVVYVLLVSQCLLLGRLAMAQDALQDRKRTSIRFLPLGVEVLFYQFG